MPVGATDFPTVSTPPLGAYSDPYSVGGGGERQGREVNHSSPSSARIEKGCIYAFAHLIRLLGVDRKNFTFPNLYPFTATSRSRNSVMFILAR